jgi:hypothetical protein
MVLYTSVSVPWRYYILSCKHRSIDVHDQGSHVKYDEVTVVAKAFEQRFRAKH